MTILKDRLYLPIIFLFLVSFVWFSKIFYIWDADTGLWYLISNHFNDTYIPYKNEFDNKGPLFYLFIKFISNIIGYGVYQAYFVYSLIIFIFFLTLLYLLNQKQLDFKTFWILILSFTSIFFMRKPHVVFILFYYSFFILFIYFLIKSIERKSIKYFIISVFIFSLCSIILVEIFLYSPLILLAYIKLFILDQKKIINAIIYPILCLTIFVLINLLPKIYYGYSFNEFLTSFALYKTGDSIGPVNSINFIYYLTLTLILPLFLLSFHFSNFKSLFIKRFEYFTLSIFLIITILKYLYFADGSSSRYLLYLYIPLIFFIIYFSNFIKINKVVSILFLIITFFVHGKNLAPPILKNIIQHNCFINFFCDAPSYANLFKGTVEYLNKNNDRKYYYVDINGWVLIMTKSDFHGVINNYYIYSCKSGNCTDKKDNNEPFITDGLLLVHNKFLNGDYGNSVIYDWSFIRSSDQLSAYWGQIKKKEKIQKSLGHYHLSEINITAQNN